MNQKKSIAQIIEQTQMEINSVQADAQEIVKSVQSACEREKDELNGQHREEINLILHKCEAEKQRVKDQAKEEIESRRNVLSQMDDKEMLTNIMIALDGYGTRLNRIEQYYTENKIIEQTNHLFQDTTNRIDAIKRSLLGQLDNMYDSVENSFNESGFKNKMEYICTYMQELDSVTNDRITQYTNQLFQDLTGKIDGMTGRLTNQIDDMNSSIEQSLGGSEVKNTIDSIGTYIVGIGKDIDEIKESICDGYGTSIADEVDDIKEDVETIKNEINSIKESVDEIHEGVCEEFSYNSLASKVKEVKEDMDSIKESIDEIHEGVCEEYSYNSLASKIQEVKDSVSETKDIIESRFG